ncbi:MAG: hypothetical protein ACRECV_01110 [Xanthobacteraceae bacterium]
MSASEIQQVARIEHSDIRVLAATLTPGFASLNPGYGFSPINSETRVSSHVAAGLAARAALLAAV